MRAKRRHRGQVGAKGRVLVATLCTVSVLSATQAKACGAPLHWPRQDDSRIIRIWDELSSTYSPELLPMLGTWQGAGVPFRVHVIEVPTPFDNVPPELTFRNVFLEEGWYISVGVRFGGGLGVSGSHIIDGNIRFNDRYPRPNQDWVRKDICFAVGHAFGAPVRDSGSTCMNVLATSPFAEPDAVDRATIASLYDHTDALADNCI